MQTLPTTPQGTVPINGQRMKVRRKSLGMTQQALADATGISRAYLAEIEQGQKLPRPVYFTAIATALHVDPVDLIARSAL